MAFKFKVNSTHASAYLRMLDVAKMNPYFDANYLNSTVSAQDKVQYVYGIAGLNGLGTFKQDDFQTSQYDLYKRTDPQRAWEYLAYKAYGEKDPEIDKTFEALQEHQYKLEYKATLTEEEKNLAGIVEDLQDIGLWVLNKIDQTFDFGAAVLYNIADLFVGGVDNKFTDFLKWYVVEDPIFSWMLNGDSIAEAQMQNKIDRFYLTDRYDTLEQAVNGFTFEEGWTTANILDFAGQAAGSLGDMSVFLLDGLVPGLGSSLYWCLMASETMEQSMEIDNPALRLLSVGGQMGIEYLTEQLFASSFTGGVLNPSKWITTSSGIGRFFAKVGIEALTEGTEEILAEVGGTILNQILTSTFQSFASESDLQQVKPEWDTLLERSAIAGMTGALIGAIGVGGQLFRTSKTSILTSDSTTTDLTKLQTWAYNDVMSALENMDNPEWSRQQVVESLRKKNPTMSDADIKATEAYKAAEALDLKHQEIFTKYMDQIIGQMGARGQDVSQFQDTTKSAYQNAVLYYKNYQINSQTKAQARKAKRKGEPEKKYLGVTFSTQKVLDVFNKTVTKGTVATKVVDSSFTNPNLQVQAKAGGFNNAYVVELGTDKGQAPSAFTPIGTDLYIDATYYKTLGSQGLSQRQLILENLVANLFDPTIFTADELDAFFKQISGLVRGLPGYGKASFNEIVKQKGEIGARQQLAKAFLESPKMMRLIFGQDTKLLKRFGQALDKQSTAFLEKALTTNQGRLTFNHILAGITSNLGIGLLDDISTFDKKLSGAVKTAIEKTPLAKRVQKIVDIVESRAEQIQNTSLNRHIWLARDLGLLGTRTVKERVKGEKGRIEIEKTEVLALKQSIITYLRSTGIIARRLSKDNYGKDMSLDDITLEMFSEMILTDTGLQYHLGHINPKFRDAFIAHLSSVTLHPQTSKEYTYTYLHTLENFIRNVYAYSDAATRQGMLDYIADLKTKIKESKQIEINDAELIKSTFEDLADAQEIEAAKQGAKSPDRQARINNLVKKTGEKHNTSKTPIVPNLRTNAQELFATYGTKGTSRYTELIQLIQDLSKDPKANASLLSVLVEIVNKINADDAYIETLVNLSMPLKDLMNNYIKFTGTEQLAILPEGFEETLLARGQDALITVANGIDRINAGWLNQVKGMLLSKAEAIRLALRAENIDDVELATNLALAEWLYGKDDSISFRGWAKTQANLTVRDVLTELGILDDWSISRKLSEQIKVFVAELLYKGDTEQVDRLFNEALFARETPMLDSNTGIANLQADLFSAEIVEADQTQDVDYLDNLNYALSKATGYIYARLSNKMDVVFAIANFKSSFKSDLFTQVREPSKETRRKQGQAVRQIENLGKNPSQEDIFGANLFLLALEEGKETINANDDIVYTLPYTKVFDINETKNTIKSTLTAAGVPTAKINQTLAEIETLKQAQVQVALPARMQKSYGTYNLQDATITVNYMDKHGNIPFNIALNALEHEFTHAVNYIAARELWDLVKGVDLKKDGNISPVLYLADVILKNSNYQKLTYGTLLAELEVQKAYLIWAYDAFVIRRYASSQDAFAALSNDIDQAIKKRMPRVSTPFAFASREATTAYEKLYRRLDVDAQTNETSKFIRLEEKSRLHASITRLVKIQTYQISVAEAQGDWIKTNSVVKADTVLDSLLLAGYLYTPAELVARARKGEDITKLFSGRSPVFDYTVGESFRSLRPSGEVDIPVDTYIPGPTGRIYAGNNFTFHNEDVFNLLDQMIANRELVDHITTDIPYNVRIAAWDTNFNVVEFVKKSVQVLKPGGFFLIFCGDAQATAIHDALYQNGLDDIHLLTWEKTNTFGKEYFIIGQKPAVGKGPKLNIVSDIIRYARTSTQQQKRMKGGIVTKPLGLMTGLLKVFTKPGQTIFDGTANTGAIGVAALNMNLKYIGAEINPQKAAAANYNLQNPRRFITKQEPLAPDWGNIMEYRIFQTAQNESFELADIEKSIQLADFAKPYKDLIALRGKYFKDVKGNEAKISLITDILSKIDAIKSVNEFMFYMTHIIITTNGDIPTYFATLKAGDTTLLSGTTERIKTKPSAETVAEETVEDLAKPKEVKAKENPNVQTGNPPWIKIGTFKKYKVDATTAQALRNLRTIRVRLAEKGDTNSQESKNYYEVAQQLETARKTPEKAAELLQNILGRLIIDGDPNSLFTIFGVKTKESKPTDDKVHPVTNKVVEQGQQNKVVPPTVKVEPVKQEIKKLKPKDIEGRVISEPLSIDQFNNELAKYADQQGEMNKDTKEFYLALNRALVFAQKNKLDAVNILKKLNVSRVVNTIRSGKVAKLADLADTVMLGYRLLGAKTNLSTWEIVKAWLGINEFNTATVKTLGEQEVKDQLARREQTLKEKKKAKKEIPAEETKKSEATKEKPEAEPKPEATIPAEKSKPTPKEYVVGDTVEHQKYGKGRITTINKEEGLLTIQFKEEYGVKTIRADFDGLTNLGLTKGKKAEPETPAKPKPRAPISIQGVFSIKASEEGLQKGDEIVARGAANKINALVRALTLQDPKTLANLTKDDIKKYTAELDRITDNYNEWAEEFSGTMTIDEFKKILKKRGAALDAALTDVNKLHANIKATQKLNAKENLAGPKTQLVNEAIKKLDAKVKQFRAEKQKRRDAALKAIQGKVDAIKQEATDESRAKADTFPEHYILNRIYNGEITTVEQFKDAFKVDGKINKDIIKAFSQVYDARGNMARHRRALRLILGEEKALAFDIAFNKLYQEHHNYTVADTIIANIARIVETIDVSELNQYENYEDVETYLESHLEPLYNAIEAWDSAIDASGEYGLERVQADVERILGIVRNAALAGKIKGLYDAGGELNPIGNILSENIKINFEDNLTSGIELFPAKIDVFRPELKKAPIISILEGQDGVGKPAPFGISDKATVDIANAPELENNPNADRIRNVLTAVLQYPGTAVAMSSIISEHDGSMNNLYTEIHFDHFYATFGDHLRDLNAADWYTLFKILQRFKTENAAEYNAAFTNIQLLVMYYQRLGAEGYSSFNKQLYADFMQEYINPMISQESQRLALYGASKKWSDRGSNKLLDTGNAASNTIIGLKQLAMTVDGKTEEEANTIAYRAMETNRNDFVKIKIQGLDVYEEVTKMVRETTHFGDGDPSSANYVATISETHKELLEKLEKGENLTAEEIVTLWNIAQEDSNYVVLNALQGLLQNKARDEVMKIKVMKTIFNYIFKRGNVTREQYNMARKLLVRKINAVRFIAMLSNVSVPMKNYVQNRLNAFFDKILINPLTKLLYKGFDKHLKGQLRAADKSQYLQDTRTKEYLEYTYDQNKDKWVFVGSTPNKVFATKYLPETVEKIDKDGGRIEAIPVAHQYNLTRTVKPTDRATKVVDDLFLNNHLLDFIQKNSKLHRIDEDAVDKYIARANPFVTKPFMFAYSALYKILEEDDRRVVRKQMMYYLYNLAESEKLYTVKEARDAELAKLSALSETTTDAKKKTEINKRIQALDEAFKNEVTRLANMAFISSMEVVFKSDNKMFKFLHSLGESHPIMKFLTSAIVPFPRVSSNILIQLGKYSPFGLGAVLFRLMKVKRWGVDLKTDDPTKVDDSMFLYQLAKDGVKGAVGSALWLMGIILGSLGLLKIDLDNKYRGVVLDIGGVKVDISNLSVLAPPLLLGASLSALTSGDLEKGVNDFISEFTGLTFLGNVFDTFQAYDSTSGIARFLDSYILSFVPSIIKSLFRAIDPHVKDYSDATYFQKLFYKVIPFLAPNKKDPYTGLDQTRFKVPFWNDLFNAILPAAVYQYPTSTTQQISEEYSVGLANYTEDTISFDGQEGKLTSEQRQVYNATRGKVYNELVSDITASKEWQKADAEKRATLLSSARSKATAVARIELWLSIKPTNKYYYISETDLSKYVEQYLKNTRIIQIKKLPKLNNQSVNYWGSW